MWTTAYHITHSVGLFKNRGVAIVLAGILLLSAFGPIFSELKLGPVSVWAAITIIYVVFLWGEWLFLLRPVSRTLLLRLLPLLLFMAWAWCSLVWYKVTLAGLQNLILMTAFLGSIMQAAHLARRAPERVRWVVGGLEWGIWIALAIYGIGLWKEGVGAKELLHSRSFAMFALTGLAWQLAQVRGGRRVSYWQMGFILGAIIVSLSRAVMGAALIMVLLAYFRPTGKGIIQFMVIASLAVASTVMLFRHFEPLKERFTQGDLRSVEVLAVGKVAVNMSGRNMLWEITLRSAQGHWWFGKGAGAVQEEISSVFNGKLEHPHNEYLRLFHDYGVIGLLLFLISYFSLAWRSWKAYQQEYIQAYSGTIHLASTLALVGQAIVMITDNSLVYLFAIVPVGIMCGLSLGKMNRVRRKQKTFPA
ncbi:O-antigen ligase family protein [Rhodocaloribacter litoris]|uniref:O-antigen ligase family protein n=1 Tax=Rhodocaloribacter litoris TaxID=2558931 RepID=UPI001E492E7C|nr:O-antigen ligase family protein [Rhodocaloribacter litoris]QXD14344.1 O-antigen ligase family protein [Rhodocaloribacter litoris]